MTMEQWKKTTNGRVILDVNGAWLIHCDRMFNLEWEKCAEGVVEPGTVNVYGVHKTPRLISNYGAEYRFSGSVFKAEPNEPELVTAVLDAIKKLGGLTMGTTGVLINKYRNGEDNIGAHSDDESGLISGAPIFIAAFGCPRELVFRSRSDAKTVKVLSGNGSLTIMGGRLQETHTHAIPKRKRITAERLSLTIRSFTSRLAESQARNTKSETSP